MTGVSFVATAKGAAITGGNAASGVVLALPIYLAKQYTGQNNGQRLDPSSNLSAAGYAKNCGFYLSLSASTPITIDLTSIATNATNQAGDNSFATAYSVEMINLGTSDITVGGASSYPFELGLGGSTQTFTVPAGGSFFLLIPAGLAIASGTNSLLKFSSGSSAGQIGVAIGGA